MSLGLPWVCLYCSRVLQFLFSNYIVVSTYAQEMNHIEVTSRVPSKLKFVSTNYYSETQLTEDKRLMKSTCSLNVML